MGRFERWLTCAHNLRLFWHGAGYGDHAPLILHQHGGRGRYRGLCRTVSASSCRAAPRRFVFTICSKQCRRSYGSRHDATRPRASLPAFLRGQAPTQPYRVAILIDPENNLYKEVDRSDRADPANPQVWQGTINSARVGMYFPTIDGQVTVSYGILRLHISNDIIRMEPTAWFYWRGRIPYDCIGAERDGEFTSDLIRKLKAEANRN